MNISTKQDSRVKPLDSDQKKGGQINKLLGGILINKSLAYKGRLKPSRMPDLDQVANVKPRKKPYPFQRIAIKNVIKGFEAQTRGQLIMPCGTGKTLVSLWIQEEMNAKRTLVLFPSLALLRQTKNEWNRNRLQPIPYICVCSEKDIDSHSDSISLSPTEVDGNVTSNPETLRHFLESGCQSIVFCTYQSIPVVGEALKRTSLFFDIIFCDEAHKTAGAGKSCFKIVHDNAVIPADRRLYMTATPRVYKEGRIGKAKEDPRIVSDMSNREIFGDCFHRLSFRQAIDMGILVDYKVVVVGVLEEEIAEFIKNSSLVSEDILMEDIVHNYAVQKFMQEWGAKNIISFHSSIKRAQNFTARHERLFPHVGSFHVNGKQPTSVREGYLKQFGDSCNSVVSNARCLTEGVDIPAIDGVFYCDPKNSHIDIMQGLGRALRRADHRNKNTAYIVVPTLHSKGSDIEDEISKGRFGTLMNVIYAINSHDDTFIERLQNQIREAGLGKNQSDCLARHREKAIEVFSANIDFSQYLYTQCLGSLINMRVLYPELQAFVRNNHIDTIIKYQAALKAGKLPSGSPWNPVKFYKECENWYYLFGREKPKSYPRPAYPELQSFVKSNYIDSKSKYNAAYKARKLPAGSPATPVKVYEECEGWWHLFGKQPRSRIRLPYRELQAFVRNNHIDTIIKYQAALKAGLLPLGAPFNPLQAYKECEGWWHLFGKDRPKPMILYLELKKWLKDNGINTRRQYYAAYKAGLLPPNSPSEAGTFYPECKGWGYLFDKKKRGPLMPYLELKKWLKDNGINMRDKYYVAFRAGLLPSNSPAVPMDFYPECGSWSELFDKIPRKRNIS